MTAQRTASPGWEPTWRRVLGTTVVLFVVILAFLVGRVRSGADAGLARSATPAVQTAPPAATQPAPSVDPNDPLGGQADPNANGGGTGDTFGNAVPDQSGGTQDDSQGGGTQDFDPPSTHVS